MFYLKPHMLVKITFRNNLISTILLLFASLFVSFAYAAAPAVSITSPADSATLKTGIITVKGTSTDDNKVRRVEAYMVLTSSTNKPYKLVTNTGTNYSTWSINFNITTAGTYKVVARATDLWGYQTTTTITVNVAVPDTTAPTVSISPASGTYTTAQTVTLTASASDNVGISKVEFYDGGVLKATEIYSPYTYNWAVSNSINGTHSWTAKAYDASGNSKVSAAVNLTVNVPVPDTTAPTVSISSPAPGATYTTAQTVTLTASASDNVGISKIEFYDGGVLKGTDYTSPYNYSWAVSSSDNGTHNWTAKSYDAAGNSKVSAAVSLTVNVPISDTTAPTVSISSPASGATYTTAQTVTLTASVSDNVGVSKVEFYDGGILKGTDSTSPYNYVWSVLNTENGTHNWTAKAYDAAGNSKVSSSISLNVNIAASNVFDDFNDGPYELVDGSFSPNNKWKDIYNGANANGQGKAGVKINNEGKKVFYQTQVEPIGDSEICGGNQTCGTTSGNVLSVDNTFKNYKLSLDVRTLRSMRSNPNPWEVAWFFFRYVDRAKHYYFYVGYNGWELGKKDVTLLPDGNIDKEEQRFLATGNNFKLQLGVWQHWDIEVVGNHIQISINGTKIVDLYDDGTRSDYQGPIPAMRDVCYQGHIGMYNEDADVEYDNITITPLP